MKKIQIGFVFLLLVNLFLLYFMLNTGAYKTWTSYEVLTASDLNAQFLLAQLKTAMSDSIDAWFARDTLIQRKAAMDDSIQSWAVIKTALDDSLLNNYGIDDTGTAWIDSAHIKTGGVSNADLRNDAVTSTKIQASAVDSTDIVNAGISGTDIVNPLRLASTTYFTSLVDVAANLSHNGYYHVIDYPATNQTGTGTISNVVVGEAVTVGKLLRKDTTSKYRFADADSLVTMPAAVIALGTISANASGNVLFKGFYRDDSWAWNRVGQFIYASTTTGAIDTVKVSAAGDQLQQIGTVVYSNVIEFKPEMTIVEIQ